MTPSRFSSVFLEDQGGLASHPLGPGLSGSFFFELQGVQPEYSTSSPSPPARLLMPGEQGRPLCGQRPQLFSDSPQFTLPQCGGFKKVPPNSPSLCRLTLSKGTNDGSLRLPCTFYHSTCCFFVFP